MRDRQRWWVYLTLVYGFAFLAVLARASWRMLHITEAEREALRPLLQDPMGIIVNRMEVVLLDPWFWVMSFVLWGPWLFISLAAWAEERQRLRSRIRARDNEGFNDNDD